MAVGCWTLFSFPLEGADVTAEQPGVGQGVKIVALQAIGFRHPSTSFGIFQP